MLEKQIAKLDDRLQFTQRCLDEVQGQKDDMEADFKAEVRRLKQTNLDLEKENQKAR